MSVKNKNWETLKGLGNESLFVSKQTSIKYVRSGYMRYGFNMVKNYYA